MARLLRPEWPGALYCVTSRSDRRASIVEDDEDSAAWVTVPGQACERAGWWVHARCLATNRDHPLLETSQGQWASGLRRLNGLRSQCFPGRHRLELARHAVLNPVRAGSATDAAQGIWSPRRAVPARP